jgi:hypothetical protein
MGDWLPSHLWQTRTPGQAPENTRINPTPCFRPQFVARRSDIATSRRERLFSTADNCDVLRLTDHWAA